jgi:beta-glucosidase/6-phospho-beta-glucosidase/beta-galactosidase
LTPPTRFTKSLGQNLLPSPLRDLPIGEPVSTDPYWKSLRGWKNHETVEAFITFVATIVQDLKDQIDYWITFAEPVTSIMGSGYIAGLWPPGFLLDGKRAKKVLHDLIEAHVLGVYENGIYIWSIRKLSQRTLQRVSFVFRVHPPISLPCMPIFAMRNTDEIIFIGIR